MSELSEAPESLSITEFRNAIGPIFTDAVRKHRPVKIDRGRRESGLLLGVDDALVLVQGHEFHPEVYDDKQAVSIWLPEFDIYGQGNSFEDAREDLLAEVRVYVREYLNNSELYMHAPNRAHHFGHVVKAWLADSMDRLADVVFAQPQQHS
jgi:antitoxin YefM